MKISVAYLGIPGSNSEQAARKYFGNGDEITDISARSFVDIFDAVESGHANFGVLPLENSLAGTVAQSYELLTRHENIHVVGEIILPIEHALMALPGVRLEDIRYVRSHPQALAQCEIFLKEHDIESIEWYNTAGSARDLAGEKLTDTAAIASPDVADIFGLNIIAENIQDIPENYTRFLVLSKQTGERSPEANKTSLVFTTRHEPGALVNCLLTISNNGLNLTKIESRPLRHTPWQYCFHIDFEGHIEDHNAQKALDELRQKASMVRVIGSYPAAEELRKRV